MHDMNAPRPPHIFDVSDMYSFLFRTLLGVIIIFAIGSLYPEM